MDTRNDIIGVIFPIFRRHFQRLLDDEKTVFVKFVARAFRRLRSGSRLFFYESRGNKEIVGEARVVDINSGTPDELLRKFGKNLILTRRELEEYTGDRRTKEMLVLVVRNARKYAIPLRLNKSVSMAGLYMTKEMYRGMRTVRPG